MSLTFAGLLVGDGSCRISVVAFTAIMTVSPGSEVLALQANASTYATRKFVQLDVESAFARV